ncbi:hypothetical protein H072_614 [Dactylellina haptotyla CBS 200.50]|uniref:Major facilitator superfamily (MFS) profile domain-containing protein n=1 Tax=Dactylellina haptotyla (strain CBS 200.50) TaxID=1284197 RepID=S8AR49_DACHA|nr:hypothetical protein H072_614 [Dactylellina haptotyla CBS 200.50]
MRRGSEASGVAEATNRRISQIDPNIVDEAAFATDQEVKMTLKEGIKLYPHAIGWSVLLSCAIIMEGFDVVLITSFFGFPQFNKKYGYQQADGTYNIPASWQTALSNGAYVGEIIGLFINGIVSERYGYRKTMIASLTFLAALIFIPFFSNSIEVLLVGCILMGIPWGVFQTLTTAYASEVCPTALRAYLTTFVNLCWVIGQLTSTAVLRGFLSREDQWAYRIPYALQWIWPVPIIIGCIFAPESPWWLVRQNRVKDAENSVRRLTAAGSGLDIQKTVSLMIRTNELEKEITSGTSYLDCFKGTDLRRTEIACMVWGIQTMCGSGLMGYSIYFLQQAGVAVDKSFDFTMGQYALGICGTISSWCLMTRVGRRTLYIWGLIGLFIVLIVIGCLAIPKTNMGIATGAALLVFTLIYDITVGPVCYSLVSEMSTTRLRAKSIVLARNFYNIMGILNNVITPRLVNTDSLNWKGKAGFFWAVSCFFCIIYCYFRLPEPAGRAYIELDLLFEHKVSARKFHKTSVDATNGTIRAGTESVEKQSIEHVEKI